MTTFTMELRPLRASLEDIDDFVTTFANRHIMESITEVVYYDVEKEFYDLVAQREQHRGLFEEFSHLYKAGMLGEDQGRLFEFIADVRSSTDGFAAIVSNIEFLKNDVAEYQYGIAGEDPYTIYDQSDPALVNKAELFETGASYTITAGTVFISNSEGNPLRENMSDIKATFGNGRHEGVLEGYFDDFVSGRMQAIIEKFTNEIEHRVLPAMQKELSAEIAANNIAPGRGAKGRLVSLTRRIIRGLRDLE